MTLSNTDLKSVYSHCRLPLFALQTYREPVSDYQILREKAASQRRDVERALTRFMAKTGETQSLFKDDVSTFPCKTINPVAGHLVSSKMLCV